MIPVISEPLPEEGGITMKNSKKIIGVIVTLGILCVAGCGRKAPSDQEINRFFVEHKVELDGLVNVCRSYPSIKFLSAEGDVERVFGAPAAENKEIEVIRQSQLQLQRLELVNMHCQREWSIKDVPFDMAKFTVYSQGFVFAGSGEAITYVTDFALEKYKHYIDESVYKNELNSLGKKGWYLEHVSH